MKKRVSGTEMLVLALTFGLVLTGGASAPKDPAAAAKLAADINAIKEGSAKVSGATVTVIGGFVEIKNGLTVPEGVTLDVTAKDATLGLSDSTLTVNGTVNAGRGNIRFEDRASQAVINGSGTIILRLSQNSEPPNLVVPLPAFLCRKASPYTQYCSVLRRRTVGKSTTILGTDSFGRASSERKRTAPLDRRHEEYC